MIACAWYSTLCVSPLPTFPHVHMHTHACTAPLVIHHLSEKIEEGPLWSFLMEKKASKPHPSPPLLSLRRRAWEFLLFFSFLCFPLVSFMFSSPRPDWSASCLPLIKGHFLHHHNPVRRLWLERRIGAQTALNPNPRRLFCLLMSEIKREEMWQNHSKHLNNLARYVQMFPLREITDRF